MAPTKFTLTGAWDQLRDALDPSKYSVKEKNAIRIATTQNAMYVAGQIKRSIGKSWTKNAALTILLKRSTKMLFDYGELLKAITYKVIDWKSVFVGVLKQAKGRDGKPLINVTVALHEGASIVVTERMRVMFRYLWLVTQGRMREEKLTGRAKEIYERIRGTRVIKPLSPSTTAIKIPSRPFIRNVFESRDVKEFVKSNWARAVSAALVTK